MLSSSSSSSSLSLQATYRVLVLAMQRKDVDLFRSILQRKGLPKDSTWLDYELLVKAIKLGSKRIVKLLLDYGARVFKRPGTTTPLHLTVTRHGWLNVVEKLLQCGARVGHQDSRGDTPLHLAFATGVHGHVVDMLLRHHLRDSTDVVANHQWLDFLHIACTRNDVDVVEKLVKANNASVDFRVRTHVSPSPLYAGYTPLRFAVEHGRYEIAEFLLKNGANIWASEDAERSTPLHFAFERRDFRMVDIILAHTKERYDWNNDAGVTHFMLACTGSQSHIVENHLEQADAKPWTKSSDLINKCVSNSGDYAGYTPLHFAVQFGHVDTIQLLLDYRADCCTANSCGLTAHQLAAKCRDRFVCDMLAVHCKVRAGYNRKRPTDPTFGEQAKDLAKDIHFTTMMLLRKTRLCEKIFALSRTSGFRGFNVTRFANRIYCESNRC